jgi:hypothetical protein
MCQGSGFTAPSLAELRPPLHRLRFVPMVCLAGLLQQIVFSLFAEGKIGRMLSPSLQRKMNPKLEILLWPVGLLYRKDITLG